MKYRKFGNLGWESSILAVGATGLPGSAVADSAPLDEAEAVRVIRSAIDQGVNYVDLGFPWNMDRHEPIIRVVGEALRGGYRDRVKIAATVPVRFVNSFEDLDACLDKQLEWVGTDGVDFLLLGRLTRDNWPRLHELGAVDWVDKSMKAGRFGNAGFSFHDHYQILKRIIQDYEKWSLIQFQYSYMDVDHDPGTSGISYAADMGLAVVVAEPLKGGRLTKQPSEKIAQVWAEAKRDWSLAEWGLRFVWNHPGVSTVICGMSSMEQLTENVKAAEGAGADSLTVQEEVLIGRVRDAFRKERQVPCPSCRPCMPCSVGIDVPRFFEVYNDAAMYGDVETGRDICRDEGLHPEDCIECRECENRCAKRLPIVDWLRKGRDYLSP
jgi:uncharacterized protein